MSVNSREFIAVPVVTFSSLIRVFPIETTAFPHLSDLCFWGDCLMSVAGLFIDMPWWQATENVRPRCWCGKFMTISVINVITLFQRTLRKRRDWGFWQGAIRQVGLFMWNSEPTKNEKKPVFQHEKKAFRLSLFAMTPILFVSPFSAMTTKNTDFCVSRDSWPVMPTLSHALIHSNLWSTSIFLPVSRWHGDLCVLLCSHRDSAVCQRAAIFVHGTPADVRSMEARRR